MATAKKKAAAGVRKKKAAAKKLAPRKAAAAKETNIPAAKAATPRAAKKKAAGKKVVKKKATVKKKAPAKKKAIAKKKPIAEKKTVAEKQQPVETKKTVLVTGAAGFVGSHVVEELLDAGMRVLATDFPGAYLAPARKAGAETFEADITSAESIAAVFKGQKVNYVVHVAALYDLGATREELMPVNRDGTYNVCAAARDAGAEHVIVFSSCDIYGQPENMPITEDFPANPLNAYAESKYAGEKVARKMHVDEGLPVTVIRPTVVYGPRCRYIASVFFSIPGIVRSIGDRLHGPAGGMRVLPVFTGGSLVSWVHADDLAGVVHFLLGRQDVIGEVYNVSDDRPLSLQELFATIFPPFGYEWKGVIPYSKKLVSAFAKMAMRLPDAMFQRMTKFMRNEWDYIKEEYDLSDDLQPRFDRDFLSFMLGDRVYDNSRIKALGYKLRYPDPEQGFKEAIEWYQKNKWLPRIEGMVF
jgi:nucleoside-diphosphate-sugar epimerase